MDKQGRRRRQQCLWLFGLSVTGLVLFFVFDGGSDMKTHSINIRRALQSFSIQRSRYSLNVRLQTNRLSQEVILDNGIVRLTFSKPGGDVIGIKYNGIDNLLETKNKQNNRGYWDIVWNKKPGEKINNIDTLQGAKYEVIRADRNGAEISFTRTWNVSLNGFTVPLNIDKRYIMLRNYPGFYTYTILERLDGWPEVEIGQVRIVYKLREDKFEFMAISNDRQRIMPNMKDRLTGQPLAYPEAVLLTNPSNPQLRGEVDDKYQYSCESKDNRLHGWISSDPSVGFWIITPSYEFRSAGPIKQELTSHAGPIALSMFTSAHYAGRDAVMKFEEGEAWKKVYGPVSVYLNSLPTDQDSLLLWSNAKEKMQEQITEWPFNFPQSKDFLKSDQRGTVSGHLLFRDRYIDRGTFIRAGFAYLGLASPGETGSWQTESKGYQFWSQADRKGYFSIKNILPGNYSLYAWVPGVIGDYKYEKDIIIEPGSEIQLDALLYEPPRNGPTLWEIGVPDRTAAEFYVPDPYPTLMNQLYSNHRDKFRQYGLWDRYADLYPNEDLVYTVGVDDYRSDWFFAHVTRNVGNETYRGTTWQIAFELENVERPANYTLQLALASATNMELQVRFNDRSSDPAFSTGLIGKDNAIARHGIHGLYWLYSINVPSYLLVHGNNVIYLSQTRHTGPFDGLMYDYIRLEGPPQT